MHNNRYNAFHSIMVMRLYLERQNHLMRNLNQRNDIVILTRLMITQNTTYHHELTNNARSSFHIV